MAFTCTVSPGAADEAEPADVESLALELQSLKEQLAALEPLRERVAQLERELAAARERAESATLANAGTQRDLVATQSAAAMEAPAEEDADDGISIGGALRYTYYWGNYDERVEANRGESGLDLFRINAEGRIDDFLLSAEYRYYPFMQVLHHGWFGYEFENGSRAEAGVTRVPFGLLPYASHNFWFGTPYYLGFADDYDLGAKWVYPNGDWEWQAAFFKNDEFASPTQLERYSFDVVAVGDTRNEETDQFNLRGAYTFGVGTSCTHELGASGQYGRIYNADTDRHGDHWAAAAHLDSRCGRWNVQLQASRYRYAPENPPGVPDNVIRLGGFATSYDAAARASLFVANVAYNVPLSSGFIDQLTCYNDYSIVVKDEDSFRDSELNTTGCLLGVGPLYLYLDFIQARNMVFFGDGSLAGDGEDGWKRRFNLNVGYYW
ncbi:MAG: hypothetical protein P8008_02120 [Gammaproteobacteria bacterium]